MERTPPDPTHQEETRKRFVFGVVCDDGAAPDHVAHLVRTDPAGEHSLERMAAESNLAAVHPTFTLRDSCAERRCDLRERSRASLVWKVYHNAARPVRSLGPWCYRPGPRGGRPPRRVGRDVDLPETGDGDGLALESEVEAVERGALLPQHAGRTEVSRTARFLSPTPSTSAAVRAALGRLSSRRGSSKSAAGFERVGRFAQVLGSTRARRWAPAARSRGSVVPVGLEALVEPAPAALECRFGLSARVTPMAAGSRSKPAPAAWLRGAQLESPVAPREGG